MRSYVYFARRKTTLRARITIVDDTSMNERDKDKTDKR